MNLCLGFKCSVCMSEFDVNDILYTCPHDGGNLDIVLDMFCLRQNYLPEDIIISTDFSIWRYLPLLPVDEPGFLGTPIHSVGSTPIYHPNLLKNSLGVNNFWIKDESKNPTASLKDRASALVVIKAGELGKNTIVTASTGNAGAALAGMAAAVEKKAVIFAPRTAPPAKVAQLLIYGADVYLVDGNYDDAFDLSIQVAGEYQWYCRNTGYNPYTVEGKKTTSYEIWEYFQHMPVYARPKQPLNIFVSVGDGNIISGIHKGFKDLVELGWMEQLPRLFGVQAEGSASIADAFHTNSSEIKKVNATTIADSISVDFPRDGYRALKSIRESNGQAITVSDQEILSSLAKLGQAGIFAEPAGAAAYAGVIKAINTGKVHSEDPIFVINTGSGLKDIRAAIQSVHQAPIIEPTLQAFKKVVKL